MVPRWVFNVAGERLALFAVCENGEWIVRSRGDCESWRKVGAANAREKLLITRLQVLS